MTEQPNVDPDKVLDEDPEDYGEERPVLVVEDEDNDDPDYDPANDERDGVEPMPGEFKTGPFSGKESD